MHRYGASAAWACSAFPPWGMGPNPRVDVEKFYDSLSPEKLLSKLFALGFPPVQLALHYLCHTACRVIKDAVGFSGVVCVTRSVLAGCTSSNSMARGYLYEVCERIHSSVPAALPGSFVDDINLRVEGSPGGVRKTLVNVVVVCVRGRLPVMGLNWREKRESLFPTCVWRGRWRTNWPARGLTCSTPAPGKTSD